ncbi:LysR substrate-binding domain-containing protein [Piscinibacter koreensis]|uniref:LysR family transcriptional regulator n=1 Tax=Piscinibacter koreensis TaxID=2742824 RepID=A0A7Y6NQ71_9BURK|nr:LysR substrate-binding domain-containing protein [Schlegelella koreensis]NUZ07299.1 LysR family transcriptional regulator [Schlegelella koreensis]
MSRRLPPLNAIRAFEAAGRYVSFTKAAVELNVTHGAVSRQVALLEEWLGTSLFRRTPSQLALTDAGRAYLAEVTAALDRIAVASLQLTDQAAPTTLHINAPPTFAMRWLIARLSGFQRRRPEVEIRMTTSLAPVNFQEHTYDVAIRGAQAPLLGCVSKPFMTELIVPVCHVDLTENGRLRVPADLVNQSLIGYSTEPYAWADWLQAVGEPNLKPAGMLKFEQMYFALQAAAEGLGVVLVPLFLAIDDIIAGRLCTPFGPLAAKQRRYYANAAQSGPAIDAFFEWLLREGHDTERSMAEWARSAGWPEDALPL